MRAALAVALVVAVASAAAAEPRDLTAEIAALRAQVNAHPDDTDAKLELATRLSWTGQRDEARRLALDVIRRAPRYWDAYLLIARIDAWDGNYARARGQLAVLFRLAPDYLPGHLLEADTYLWENRPDDARRALAEASASAAGPPSPEVVYRLAQADLLDGDTWRAHRRAADVLTADPAHPQARAIYDATRRFLVDLAGEVETFPFADPALATTATAVAFLRARTSVTGQYEYRWRFGRHNHRAAVRADWRPHRAVTLSAYVRGGPVEILPFLTTWAAIEWQPRPGKVATARYLYDRFRWRGQLHRGQLEVGHPIAAGFRAEGAYTVGVLLRCSDPRRLVQAVRAGVGWERGRWVVGAAYSNGNEFERPDNGDARDDCQDLSNLFALTSHALGGTVTFKLDPRSSLLAGYGATFREAGVSHLGALAVRRSF